MSRRRNLRRRAERAHRCYTCRDTDRLRMYRNRVYCMSCYWAMSSESPVTSFIHSQGWDMMPWQERLLGRYYAYPMTLRPDLGPYAQINYLGSTR